MSARYYQPSEVANSASCSCKHLFSIVLQCHLQTAVADYSDEREDTLLSVDALHQMQMRLQCERLYVHSGKFLMKVHHLTFLKCPLTFLLSRTKTHVKQDPGIL